MHDRTYYVYMITSDNRNTIYTGVTNDIRRRLCEHKTKVIPGFTEKYQIYKLVYFEAFAHVVSAIKREKQIKKGSRAKKIELIEGINPLWEDLSSWISLFSFDEMGRITASSFKK